MLKEFTQEIKHSHNRFGRLLFALAAVIAVVLILPRETRFKYEFEQGKPWLHQDLIAPFDFPILKTDEQIQQEKQRIKESVKPVFVEDIAVRNESVKRLETGVEFEFEDREMSTDKAVSYASRELSDIYKTGVLEQTTAAKDAEVVKIVKNRFEEKKSVTSLLSPKQAAKKIEELFSDDPPDDSLMLRNLIIENIRPNLIYDPELTQKIYSNRIEQVSEYFGKVAQNEKIISRGEVVDAESYQKLRAFKKAYLDKYENTQTTGMLFAGQFLLVGTAVFVLLFYMAIYKTDVFNEFNKFALTLILFILWVYMSALSIWFEDLNIYVLPFCIMPLIVRNFFDARLASFLFIITIVIIGLIAPNPFEFIFIQLMTGLVALFTLTGMRKRSQFITSAFVIFISYAVLYYSFSIIREGAVQNIDHGKLLLFGGSALLTLPAYPIIFLFEKTFGLISDVTLLEISDTNNKALRKLNLKAPGTFQHSVQVANLAEEAAGVLGADSLLVRTGALYHDIGKMKRPGYFIENQNATGNPHDDLPPEKSAEIIVNHVIDGIETAREIGLPEQIIDFIRTHHGTTCTLYFYNKARQKDEHCDIDDYRYPGPIPFNKETAILMMADSVEAASRSLKKHDSEKIENLVDKIIDNQLREDQFINADITLRDISTVKKIFKRRLKNIYHVRVEYPR